MRVHLRRFCAALAFSSPLAAGAAHAVPFRYEGVCEASAAVGLGRSHFAVASDETNRLTIYRRGQASPVRTVTAPDVTDIEAAARIGTTVFWLTSHSLNRDGEDKPKRKRLFAMSVRSGPTLVPAGTVYSDLRRVIAQALGRNEAELAQTLNIEGMASTRARNLVVGLRAPLDPDGRAIVVRISRPFALVGLPQGHRSETVPPVSLLDLGGRGIRAIERIGSGARTFLIVAGPVADGGQPGPALFWWDGQNAVTPGPVAPDLAGMTPEALSARSSRRVQVLGDNGSACSDEADNPRWFPSIDLRIG